MRDRLRFFWNRLRERLWFKPLIVSLLSVGGAFVAKSLDFTELGDALPEVKASTNEALLDIMASSMLVIATFAVASMVSAYASASNTATPRSFPLVVADDDSQNALSSFIGAFIFSIVSMVAMHNGYYGKAGHFLLFVLTMLVFAWVVLTFVRWVDRIARLGRLKNVVDKVESATARALEQRRNNPNLGGVPPGGEAEGEPVFSDTIGYVQRIDVPALQAAAEQADCRVFVQALPGTFATPDRPLAVVPADAEIDDAIRDAFTIGDSRVFDYDPRLGLVVLAEIAARALSPAVNDPGTAIDIIGTFVRLFTDWIEPLDEEQESGPCDRVFVPGLLVSDMFEDAFPAIARDGAGSVEVQVRLQKALRALHATADEDLQQAAEQHSRMALQRATQQLQLDEEIAILRELALSAAGKDNQS